MSGDGLVEAFRRQCHTAIRAGSSPGLVYLAWRGQQGITDDQMIDVLKDLDAPSEVPHE